MKLDKNQLLASLKESYRDVFDETSRRVGITPKPIDRLIESTGGGEMVAAMIGITGAGVRVTTSIIADKPVVTGAYATAYAALLEKTQDDETALFGEFADTLTEAALTKTGVAALSVTPAQVMEGQNFKNMPSNKSAVTSFSMPFELPEGMLYINMSIHA
ncbi:hypothetical protein LJC31_03560 [Synergistaceae bacterium OttesenSCG-928-I11]|nr:hypothetical protein [Synergistaceae bacterium OttesenSCG-928-I11]